MSWKRQLTAVSAALVAMVLVVGCDGRPGTDYGELELLDVGGRVTLDGIPLYDAGVVFESPDQTTSSGRTNLVGEYRLMFNSERRGCRPGEKIVRISMRPAGEEDPDAEETSGIAIPARYNTESELRATVSANERRFDFDLTTQ